jgi:hypothetical protein
VAGPPDPRAAVALAAAGRTVRNLLRRRLGPRASIDDGATLVEREVARLLAEGSTPEGPGSSPERRASVLAYELGERLLRKRHANRWRLRSRLRYVLTHHQALSLWLDPRGNWLAGLAGWEGQPLPPRPYAPARPPRSPSDASDLAATVSAIFMAANRPVALDELLDAIARALKAADAAGTEAAVDLATPHPAYEELACYADGVLEPGPNGAVAAHLSACPDCAAETQELQHAWRTLLAPSTPTPTMPIPVPRSPGLWARLRARARRLLGRPE